MSSFTLVATSELGLPPNSYIYRVISTAPQQDPLTYSRTDQIAFISSDDSLRYLDTATFQTSAGRVIESANKKVVCLEKADAESGNIIATAGRDGLIKFWDSRTENQALVIQSPRELISSLLCDLQRNIVAAGIENPNDGPDVSPVLVWDPRKPSTPIRSYVDSHTDTITSLQLHPSHSALLLSSSTDGLINIFDTSQAEEEDALYQVVNHRSAIAHAGFMYPSTDIYAIGTDETLSFHALQSQWEEEEEPAPRIFGDVRVTLGCDYVTKLHWIGSQPFLAAGKHSESQFALVPLSKDRHEKLNYHMYPRKSASLPGAHGEELVRDLFTDVHSRTTFTCGEDGCIRAWQATSQETSLNEEAELIEAKEGRDRNEKAKDKNDEKKGKKRKGDEKEKTRYRPY